MDRVASRTGSAKGEAVLERYDAMGALDRLVGEWEFQVLVSGEVVSAGRSVFAWQDGGAYLRQHTEPDPPAEGQPSDWAEHGPGPTSSMIGLDDSTGEFTMLYRDSRGVHRVYRMTVSEEVWTIWRDAPGFHQRFTATFGPGATVTGYWEMSEDGSGWHKDFDVRYIRV